MQSQGDFPISSDKLKTLRWFTEKKRDMDDF